MKQLFIDINENFEKLLDRFYDFILGLSDEKVQRFFDDFLKTINTYVNQIYLAVQSIDLKKMIELGLNFIQEVEQFLIDLYNRFSFKNEEEWADGTRAITSTLKNQLIYLDQKRQSYSVFQ